MRKFLPLLGLLIGLIWLWGLLQPSMPEPSRVNQRSVYENSPGGYRAWALVNEKAGIPIAVWSKPFEELDAISEPTTMLIIEPYSVSNTSVLFGEEALAELLQWVQQGNTLVLLDNFRRHHSSVLLKHLGLRWKDGDHALGALQMSNISTGRYIELPLSSQQQQWLIIPDNSPAQVLLSDAEQHPVLVKQPYGKGHFIVGTVADLASNDFLHQRTDNYQFLSNVLLAEGKPVFVNEFVHGFSELPNLFAYYQAKTPLGQVATQCLLLLLLLFWYSMNPKQAPKSLKQPEELPDALNNHIRAVAHFYQAHHATSLVIEAQLKRIQQILQQRYRLPAHEPGTRSQRLLEQLLAEYSNKDELLASLQEAQEAVSRQNRVEEERMVQLCQQLSCIEEALKRAPTHVLRF